MPTYPGKINSKKSHWTMPLENHYSFAGYMKKSPLPAVLMLILAFSAVLSLYLCYAYVMGASEINRLQSQASVVSSAGATMDAVAGEVLEYSKTHPAIDPILEEARIKPASHPQAASKTTK